ncbi:hypothetical protein KAFR_0A07920 [Kazachstania africana CBS 2517]|uniref:Cysteine protease n=1 Tax=Kazachstania africana (strain ATCC 22294 / BCRC 22015 / CBS 2517 / CECT 1963 / NBRC 1671 / NRRL Y-8276) TaxID=1071382 RepID=H2APC6_KAZAF|nr:hypothetical protein KAFR_0A07920 [Kazachstania africana CBS 2517]CCF56226.1 hypothetical protein KAFR_0A07920 [Kazachstania africana CBS 2517]
MELIQKLSSHKNETGSADQEEYPYVVLGRHYPPQSDSANNIDDNSFFKTFFNRNSNLNQDFLSDVNSRLAFTYRTKFQPILRSSEGPSPLNFRMIFRDNPINTLENVINNPDCFNTDIGWGCMIRTGQSLLGNALQLAKLGRHFRLDNKMGIKDDEIISWFRDTTQEPFSIHKFVEKGNKLANKKPGEWFGPAATSISIQSLIEEFPECGIDKCLVSVSSGDIFEDDVREIFEENMDSKILFLMGVKLGLDAVNSFYWEDILNILDSKFSVGIAGGRPSSSLYFFGHQGNELLYFDPHRPQPSLVDPSVYETCHTTNFGKLDIKDMDPSMLIGILISGEQEWETWKSLVNTSQIINISEKRLDEISNFGDFDVDSMASSSNSFEVKSVNPLDSDYVDLGSILYGHETYPRTSLSEYQNVQCKKQKIIVLESRTMNSCDLDVEIEPVLVEQDTVGIETSENMAP